MAATSHPLATLAALDILRDGGNAVDAAVAAAALLGVAEPTQSGIGGDCFALLMRHGAGEVIALNGSGWAPLGANLDRYRRLGISSIPVASAEAVTVPGAVAAWAKLVGDHGSMPLSELLAPAIRAAEKGVPVAERIARDWAKQEQKLRADTAAAAVFVPHGTVPRAGEIHRQPALAATLRAIAAEGPAAFYAGSIARDMVDTLRSHGGCHTIEDFSSYAPEYVSPARTSYRGFELWECPPNGQGLVPLAMLKALAGFDACRWKAPLSAERVHCVVEIGRQAYADRDCFFGDPRAGPLAIDAVMSERRAAQMRAGVSFTKRMPGAAPIRIPEHSDTTFVAVVDSQRNTIALISSIFDDFGSGILDPGSGVIFHNRGQGFVLEPGHPNAIAGRKRPLHTIIPALLTRSGKPVMPFGVTGGHFQPFGQVQVLTNILDYGMGIQAAIDAPRFFARRDPIQGDVIEVEGAVPGETVNGLARLGHKVVRAENPLGTAQAIWIDWEAGVLRGGADGRRDGVALGW
jgi:gamma-glutamyltranspeptidase/glutathione hydrolase